MQDHLFEPILNLVTDTMHRDNLLNSACLELFDFIKEKHIKVLISHLVENYRAKFESITYVELFQVFVMRYDASHGFSAGMETSFLDSENDTPKRQDGRGNRWESGIKDLDAAEEEYFNTSDDEEETKSETTRTSVNGASPLSKPLVDYTSDEENDNIEADMSAGILPDVKSSNPSTTKSPKDVKEDLTPAQSPSVLSPPERLSEKRRREEDEEDEIGKLSQSKRRNSASSVTSNSSGALRRKKSFTGGRDGGSGGQKPNKIAISLSPAIKTCGDGGGGGGNGS